MNNQECKVRPEIVNVNSNEPLFYPFSIKTSKCSGSCYLAYRTHDNYALIPWGKNLFRLNNIETITV